jgi:hypothetical protein
MSEPKFFSELICLMCKPEHGERENPVTESTKSAAQRAFSILHSCKRLPGTNSDGSINGNAFNEFIRVARELCGNADRLTMCDQTLGQIFAHAPANEDGTRPLGLVREVLDIPEMEHMRLGFCVGTMNNRGVTCRSPWDGGGQERDLATYYKDQAERVQLTHTYVAEMLMQISKRYEVDATREDIQANLSKESF